MKKSLSGLFIFWLLVLPLYAQPKDLNITADKVSFDKEKNLIEAEGSVEVTYKEVMIFGNHLIYNTSTESVFADRGFRLYHEGVMVEGDTLDYAVKDRSGQASKVKFGYRGIQLNGEKLRLDSDKFRLNNASFSTCDLAEQHYHVSASEVTVYPNYGWLVAYWGLFWLGRYPIVPVPTYIYDFRAEERGHKNLPPFPEVGSNDEDGAYINQRFAWSLRRELNGTVTLGYMGNKGISGGVDADYIYTENNEGNIRLSGNFKDGFYGGLTHTYSFGGEVESSQKAPFSFFALPRYRRYELITTLSSRERINYQRVSFMPNVSLRSRAGQILSKEAKYDFEILGGLVAEQGNTDLFRGGANAKLYVDFQETSIGFITPSLGIDALYYSNGLKWVKTAMEINLVKNLVVGPTIELGYQHYFSVDGQSPFNFERYRFKAADRLRSSLLFRVGETGVKIATSYFIDDRSPEDIDYSLFFKLHCYNLITTYRSLRREFTLGFSLASSP